MKKNLVIILSFIIVTVLCFTSVPVLADNYIKIYNSEWLSDYYSGDNNYNYLFGWDNSLVSNLSLAEQALEDFESNYNLPYYIATFNYNGQNWQINFLCSQSPIIMYFGGPIYYDVRTNMVPSWWSTNSSIMIYSYVYNSSQNSFNISSWSNTDYNGTKFVFSGNSLYCFAFKGENYAISLAEINSSGVLNNYLSGNSIIAGNQDPIYKNVLSRLNVSDYFNYLQSDMPYYNGTEVIDPAAQTVENNTNHLYLTGCDAGFTKPLSLNNLNSSGGGYVYFTYNFDDWINNHSGDYTLQCNSTFYINNSSTGTIVRRNLDISGVSIFALSELGDFVDWQNLNTTFMGFPNQILTGNYIKGYVYSLTYNQFGILQERYAKAGAHTVGYWVVKFANMLPGVKITENNVSYQEYFNSVAPSRFDLKVSFKIIDNVSGEESGTYTKTFNMLTGVSNVDSNSIQDNNNPYDPVNSDDIQLPSIEDNNNGYLIETGDNNQIVNLTTPDNIKLFIDNGFQNFLSWYESSGDTAYVSNRFWSNMGIFEGNPATELYETYFGFLPEDFKSIILGCAGIGIVGGAFCILRRRLH